jgi:DNA-binding NarL/FixJ family response regulator
MPTKRVLIADDTHLMRRLIGDFLAQRPDFEICGEATNGLEAVEKAKELNPDVVLLDISMPVMPGIEAASILRKHLPEAAIILFTMTSEHYRPALLKAVGVDAVLAKADGLKALAETIDSIFERRKGSEPETPSQ